MFMLLCVKVHPGFLLGGGFVCYSHPTAATCSRGGLDEYQDAAPHRCPVATLKKPNGLGGAARGDRRRSAASPIASRKGKEKRGSHDLAGLFHELFEYNYWAHHRRARTHRKSPAFGGI